MNKNKVIVALIGFGEWGKNYLQTLRSMSEIEVRYVYSKSRKRDGNTSLTNDYEKILLDKEIVAVIIATPQNTHYDRAKKAFMSKKDVLLEKPMATNSGECLDLIKLAKKQKRILMIGHIFIYHSAIIKIKDMINKGIVGDVRGIQSIRNSKIKKAGDTNALWHLAPHDISIVNYLLDGTPNRIVSRGFEFEKNSQYDTVDIFLRYNSSTHVSIHTSWKEPEKIRKIIISGTKKIIVFDDTIEEKVKVFDTEDLEKYKIITTYGRSPLERECLHFVECIRKRSRPITDGESGYVNTKILEEVGENLILN